MHIRESFASSARRAAARLLCGAALATSCLAAHAVPELGVYRWDAPTGPSRVDAFNQWLGRPATLAVAFEANDSWDNVDGAAWQLGAWSQWVRAQPGRNLILGVPMLTASGSTLASCNAGQYDVYWRNLANELAYYGLHWAYLRLGWEMDGSWYPWKAPQGSGNEANYAGCFRRIVQTMRATQPANQWKFVWNTALSFTSTAYLSSVWPGDAYVDIVAVDIYDQSWAANTYPYPSICDAACRLVRQQNAWNANAWGLYAIRDFALARGKPMAIPEWGLNIRADGHGGGEDTYYVQKMHEFIMNPANNVAFHAYFDVDGDGDHIISGLDAPTRMPLSAALYKQLFGPASTNLAPTVSLSTPAAGQTVSGTISYAANASDDAGVSRVDFFIGTTALASDSIAPYNGSLDTTKLANGTHVLRATAYDAQGLSATSQVSINVQNAVVPPSADATAPLVSLTSPVAGTDIARRSTVLIEAAASDNVGVAWVEFLVNDRRVCLVQASPYRCVWNTGSKFERSYTIKARASDAAGNVAVVTRTLQ